MEKSVWDDFNRYRRTYNDRHPEISLNNRVRDAVNLLSRMGYQLELAKPTEEVYRQRFDVALSELMAKRNSRKAVENG